MRDFLLENTGFPLFPSQHFFVNLEEEGIFSQEYISKAERLKYENTKVLESLGQRGNMPESAPPSQLNKIRPMRKGENLPLNPCRIIIADDHVLFRQGLKNLLGTRSDLEVIGEAADGLQLLDLLNQSLPDIILLDISMPNLYGIKAVHEIKKVHPRVKILILTMQKDKQYVAQAISAGARGYLLKEDADTELFSAIEKIKRRKIYISSNLLEELTDDWILKLRGESNVSQKIEQLTIREKEILRLIAEGKGSKEIATLLFISTRTVERHRANIMHKLDARKTADLVSHAIPKGYD